MKIDKHVIAVLLLFSGLAFVQYQLPKYLAANNTSYYDQYNKQEDNFEFLNTDLLSETNSVNRPAKVEKEGYEWINCESIATSILKPNEWYFLEEENEQSSACFVTKEEISDESPSYQTGFSINTIPNASRQLPLPPEQFITSLLDEISLSFTEVEPYQVLQSDDSPLYGESTTMSSEKATVYYANYWNMETDTMYLLSYESPTAEWEEAWKQGEPLLKSVELE